MRVKPTFLGIGAQKCATTWLYDILSDHPEVCLSAEKELDFFSYYYDYGFQWYEKNFAGSERGTVGEVSPSYFHSLEAPERILDYRADIKLVLLLREPIARAISNHRHEVRIGHLTGDDLSFERGLSNNPAYINQGLYGTHLERWLRVFPRNQIHLVFFDDILADRAKCARAVFRFLDIDQAHQPAALDRKANPSYLHRFAWLSRIREGLFKAVRVIGLEPLWRRAGDAGARELYRKINRREPAAVIPAIAPASVLQLRDRFEPELSRLEEITGRDLAAWRRAWQQPC